MRKQRSQCWKNMKITRTLLLAASLTACSTLKTPASPNECPAWAKHDWLAPTPVEKTTLMNPGMGHLRNGIETLDCDICDACYPTSKDCQAACHGKTVQSLLQQ